MGQITKQVFFFCKKISEYSFGIAVVIASFFAFSCNSATTPETRALQDTANLAPLSCTMKFSVLRMTRDSFCKYTGDSAHFKKFVFQVGTHDQNSGDKKMLLYCFAIGKDVPSSGDKHVILGSFWLTPASTTPISLKDDGIYPDLEIKKKEIKDSLACMDCGPNRSLLFTPFQMPNGQISYVITVDPGTGPLCLAGSATKTLNPCPPAKPGLTN